MRLAPRLFLFLLPSLFCLLSRSLYSQDEDQATELPIKQVVLFNSGIGYFEHQAIIKGDAELELPLAGEDISDVLKSLVIQDASGGKISSVGYALPEPLLEQLSAMSIDLSSEPTLGELLHQLRGEEIAVKTLDLKGTILGAEIKSEVTESGTSVRTEYLNLLTAEGLQSVPVRNLSGIKFVNEELNRELKQALQVVAKGRRTEKRHLTFQFAGEGQRPVHVGYIHQAPVWKTSYRLLLAEAAPATLQGWAIVENTSESDWDEVRLTLISGSPISFQMALDEPHHVNRQQVAVPIPGSPLARLHSAARGLHRPEANGDAMGGAFGGMGGGGMGGMGGGGMGGLGGGGRAQRPFVTSIVPIVPTEGFQAQATGGEVGEFFRYEIDRAVSLSRRCSALVPLLTSPVEVDRFSIYTPSVDDQQLLLAARITNTTDNDLAPGPITVLDQGIYAGEAQLGHVRNKADRIVSFAADLEVKAEVTLNEEERSQVVSVALDEGRLTTERRWERTHRYRFDNLSERPKTVVIEHNRPDEAESSGSGKGVWQVVQPQQPVEASEEFFRYETRVKAGEVATFPVTEHRRVTESQRLAGLSDSVLSQLIDERAVNDEVREQLQKVLAVRSELQLLTDRMEAFAKQHQSLVSDQQRIRSNLRELDRTSDLYQRYVKTLEKQEDELQKVRDSQQEVLTARQEKQRELESLAPSGDSRRQRSMGTGNPFDRR